MVWCCALVVGATIQAPARADDDGWVDEHPAARTEGRRPLGPLSSELLDGAALTRIDLVARGLVGTTAASEGASAWTLDARFAMRLAEGWAARIVLPVGVSSPSAGDARVLLGNLSLGGLFVGTLLADDTLRVRGAAAVDVYVPTSAEADALRPAWDQAVPGMRGYEPQAFLPRVFGGRVRVGTDLTFGALTTALELGLSPLGAGLDKPKALLLGTIAARVGARVGRFEPYAEVALTGALAGPGDVAPPLFVTPGLRAYVADAFAPAIFVAISPATPAFVVGLELSVPVRPLSSGEAAQLKRDRPSGL
jgi:hypothetical protein